MTGVQPDASAMNEHTRTWAPTWPCPVASIWSTWRRGTGDPTYRLDDAGGHWRALHTPTGSATLRVRARPRLGTIEASAWGEGAAWALDSLPAMLGADDDPAGFAPLPAHESLARAHHAHRHWRVGRGGFVWQALLPAVIEQKVTGQEAFTAQRRLARRYGTPAPGPGADLGLRVPPTAEQVRAIPSWEWLTLPVDSARSATLVRAARAASGLERTIGAPDADAKLRSVPGIGVWTSAEVRQRAHGDADAVSFGDFHVARSIGWALIGEQIDNDALAALLEPYAGHRYRVQRLLELAGIRHPQHGPRMAPRAHLPRR